MRRTASPQLERLQERVEKWRSQRGKRTRIPEAFWEEACRVARVDGVWATARATRFNAQSLRQRVERLQDRRSGRGEELTVVEGNVAAASAEAAFVELPFGALGGTDRAIIDVVGQHGERMHIEVSGGVDVVGLVRTFRGGHP